MNTITIESQSFLVDESLSDFQIFKKASSNVDFFGTDHVNKKLFVQFKGGVGAYVYSDVPDKILTWAENCESIGRFVAAEVVGKFLSEKIEYRLVKPAENISEQTF